MAKPTLVDSVRAALRPLSLVGQAANKDELWSVLASRLPLRRRLKPADRQPYRFEICQSCDCVMLLHAPGPVLSSATRIREDLLIAVGKQANGNALVDLTRTHGRSSAFTAFLFEHSMPERLRRLSHVAIVVQRSQLHAAHIDQANACRHGVHAQVFTDRRSAENWLREFMPVTSRSYRDRRDEHAGHTTEAM